MYIYTSKNHSGIIFPSIFFFFCTLKQQTIFFISPPPPLPTFLLLYYYMLLFFFSVAPFYHIYAIFWRRWAKTRLMYMCAEVDCAHQWANRRRARKWNIRRMIFSKLPPPPPLIIFYFWANPSTPKESLPLPPAKNPKTRAHYTFGSDFTQRDWVVRELIYIFANNNARGEAHNGFYALKYIKN